MVQKTHAMKKADLQDIVIMQDTTNLAFYTFSKCLIDEMEYIPAVIYPFCDFSDPETGTLSICINVCLDLKHKKELTHFKYIN